MSLPSSGHHIPMLCLLRFISAGRQAALKCYLHCFLIWPLRVWEGGGVVVFGFLFRTVGEQMFGFLYSSWWFFVSFFFSGKVIKFVQAQIYVFAVWLLSSVWVHFIPFVKRKANSTTKQQKFSTYQVLLTKQQKFKGHEKRHRLLVSKV